MSFSSLSSMLPCTFAFWVRQTGTLLSGYCTSVHQVFVKIIASAGLLIWGFRWSAAVCFFFLLT